MATPSQEDYIEAIWILIQEKGYARVSDIAERLGISPASVSRMVRKLSDEGILTHERYQGLTLTSEGLRRGHRLFERHRTVESFLTILGMSDPSEIDRTVEGVEHHLGPEALLRIASLVNYAGAHPVWWEEFHRWFTSQHPSPTCEPFSKPDA